MAKTNDLAESLKRLHQPSKPIVLPNIWDIPSLKALLSLNDVAATDDPASRPVKAVATASYAVAESLGVKDEDLTFEQNFAAIERIAPLVRAVNLPLTVDLQDGYGARIEEAVAAAVRLGAAGANIEDSIPSAGFDNGIDGSLYGLEEQLDRLTRVFSAARAAGCPDFVLNARCDVFRLEPACAGDDPAVLKEAVRRGRAYLNAGATTVFYWGGGGVKGRGLRTSEVETLVRDLDGRVAVKLGEKADSLTVSDLAKFGVARISVGPSLYAKAMAAVKVWASNILTGGGLSS